MCQPTVILVPDRTLEVVASKMFTTDTTDTTDVCAPGLRNCTTTANTVDAYT